MTSPGAVAMQQVLREYILRTHPGSVKGYDHDALCDLLEVDDLSRVIFERGSGRAVVRVLPVNPLAAMRAITFEGLVMDEDGCIRIGSYYDGEPLRMRVHDPETVAGERNDAGGTKVNGQGMCYHLTSARPTSMARFFRVGSFVPHDGYDPEIRRLYGSSVPPGIPLELIFQLVEGGHRGPGPAGHRRRRQSSAVASAPRSATWDAKGRSPRRMRPG